MNISDEIGTATDLNILTFSWLNHSKNKSEAVPIYIPFSFITSLNSYAYCPGSAWNPRMLYNSVENSSWMRDCPPDWSTAGGDPIGCSKPGVECVV